MKTCPKCNIEKELYYFSYRSDTQKLRNICSMCHKGYRSNIKERQENEKKLLLEDKKECTRCHEIKSIDNFHNDKNTSSEFCSRCKECLKDLRGLNSKTIHRQVLKYRYNITDEQYEIYSGIKHCQICNTQFSEKYRKCLDHCHTKLEYRGVICSYCNIGLGHFKDNKELLLNAIKYLG